MKGKVHAAFRHKSVIAFVFLLGGLLLLSSCGGGGSAARPASAVGVTAFYSDPGIMFPAGLMPSLANVTTYAPALNQWYLYDGTSGYYWTSAIGTVAGLKATMSNPFEEVAIAVIPTDTYNNAGKVNFYIDGQLNSSLDLSVATPYTGYDDEHTTFYVIASDLEETMHTVTMEIVSGTVAFDGWRIKYDGAYYRIDASEANTLESETIAQANIIRDDVESYYHEEKKYPNPGDSSNVVDYLHLKGYMNVHPENPYSGNDMVDTGNTYSGGDYNYTYTSSSAYSLSVYGGKGTLYTATQDSAAIEEMTLNISAPDNHITTTADYATFTITPTSTYDSFLTICCGLSGQITVPATSSVAVTHEIKLAEGQNDIQVRLYDAYGHSLTMTRYITRDTTAPDVELIEPYPMVWDDDGNITVTIDTATTTVQVYVEAGATVVINDVTATESSTSPGLFYAEIPFNVGTNTLTVVATDIWSNKNEETFSIVREE